VASVSSVVDVKLTQYRLVTGRSGSSFHSHESTKSRKRSMVDFAYVLRWFRGRPTLAAVITVQHRAARGQSVRPTFLLSSRPFTYRAMIAGQQCNDR
jgi:hypothetical protein